MSAAAGSVRVVIVGAGIAGLAAAILFRRLGHPVVVLERRQIDYVSQTTGGIDLTYNSLRIIKNSGTIGLDLEEAFDGVADPYQSIFAKRYDSGESLRAIKKSRPAAMIHRTDYMRILYERAVREGVTIRTRQMISSIDDCGTRVIITLQDQPKLEADLVIGADGLESQVRRLIFPNDEKDTTPRVRDDCTFLVSVPRSVMLKYPETACLYGRPPYDIWFGPGREIVAWTMSKREVYHLQLVDHQYRDGLNYGADEDEQGGYKGTSAPMWIKNFTNMPAFRNYWKDFNVSIRTILAATSECVRWRIGSIPSTLKTWHSPSKRVVIVGDAAHGFPPFAGQGANQALEDVAALAAVVQLSLSQSNSIARAVEVWQEVRRPRIDGIREIVELNTEMFSLPDGEKQKKRDAMLKSTVKDGVKSESMASRYKWMENYDAVGEASEHWLKACATEESFIAGKL